VFDVHPHLVGVDEDVDKPSVLLRLLKTPLEAHVAAIREFSHVPADQDSAGAGERAPHKRMKIRHALLDGCIR
jgi:hypothetical protein